MADTQPQGLPRMWERHSAYQMYEENKPSYYDSPADQDFIYKGVVLSKIAARMTFVTGAADGLLAYKYTTLLPFLGRLAVWAVPCFGSMAAFIAGNAIAVKLNDGKDVPECHAVGGFAYALVWARFLRMPRFGIYLGPGIGFAMMKAKEWRNEGYLVGFMRYKKAAPNHSGMCAPPFFKKINFSVLKDLDGTEFDD